MADSNITKRALASALKELMETMPFEKITISHICDKCCMNRKSFYYHFKDKYDLVNWIYDTEFVAVVCHMKDDDPWVLFSMLCRYLYDNRRFYRKALQIRGQNSFYDHFHETLVPITGKALQYAVPDTSVKTVSETGQAFAKEFTSNFITDGIIAALERWLLGKNDINADDFLFLVRSITEKLAARVYDRHSNE